MEKDLLVTMEKKLLLTFRWVLWFSWFEGIPYWSHQCPVPLVSLAIPGASAEFYQLQSFVVGNYLGVNLCNNLLKAVQVLVPVAEPTQKAGVILGQRGCAPAASGVGLNMP